MARTYRKTFTVSKSEMHEAIGCAITQWAWVEDSMVKLMHTLLGCSLEQAGIVWYSVIAFRGKLEMVDALMQLSPKAEPVMKRWPSCQNYLGSLSTKRNQLAHWELVALSGNATPTIEERMHADVRLRPHTFDATPKMAKHRKGITTADVNFYNRQFHHAADEVRDLYLHMSGRLPWQDKFSQPIKHLQK